jgi:EAL domain-containing protein (putative c-di-GMP-specific phosphodiesterase class I)/CHASE2 domain-containing sensor protein
MIGTLPAISAFLRRALGSALPPVPTAAADSGANSGARLLQHKRAKVALFAILFGIVSAVIDLPLPAEDSYRAIRAEMRSRPAPQDIAMIAIDDKTLNAFGRGLPDRYDDSKLIDILIASGVKRVAFDRAHADPETPASDAAFAATLARHRGKVWLGFAPPHEVGFQKIDKLAPQPQFAEVTQLAAMNAIGGPFGLSVILKTEVELDGKRHPSLSATLAEYDGPYRSFRPDYAFDPITVPTFSYSDVVSGKVPAAAFAGKNVIIGTAYYESSDYFLMPFNVNGRVPGAYFHIMGAHTLKRGVPLDLMWFPAVLVAAAAIIAQAFARRRSGPALLIAAAVLFVAPLMLDELGINIDVMSGLLALLAAGISFQRITRKYYSSDVDAMTTSALGLMKADVEQDVYALKIASLAELSEDWSAREIGDFVNTLISYVKGPGTAGDVAFERDLLVWLAPRMDTDSLERHADGLALMLKTAISHDWQSSGNAPALGIDTNYALPVGQRIKKAMQAADEAANRGVRFIINDAAHLEARNQRLEIIRVLEKGLRDRSIAVGYQPKVELATGRIVGAETLIRWQPDGSDYVNPQELVLAAEASDRINELTLIVMEAALRDARKAIAIDPGFKLAINMSAKSLSDTHLLFEMMTLLGRYAFPPENLTLELTETAKLEDERIAPQINALRQRGIGLSIDDFGTGQSNLEYIEKLPSSELKIDKKFVQHMAHSEESRAVVRATIEIAHSLGKLVVAEGVEDELVAAALRDLGCDHAQGYLFARAVPMADLVEMMGRRKNAVNS